MGVLRPWEDVPFMMTLKSQNNTYNDFMATALMVILLKS